MVTMMMSSHPVDGNSDVQDDDDEDDGGGDVNGVARGLSPQLLNSSSAPIYDALYYDTARCK
eukprot:2832216-Pyramimonas_sp.AAC.1